MAGKRLWSWTIVLAAAVASGCCSWAERNCPHLNNACAPPPTCCQPCQPVCCQSSPAQAPPPPVQSWNAPNGR